jgi:DNA-binding beta-propeller fold protein YncE
VANASGRTVTALTLKGERVGEYRVGDTPLALLYSDYQGPGHIWVANYGDNTVMKLTLDGHRLAVVRTGELPAAIVAAGEALIVVNSGSQTLQKIPLQTGGEGM